ncbi:hypothetical protein GF385_03170 [Candidatus Dependentiae bacterium]|nr:hypothetical protein [Candidatus Dependentiae bacterium]
MVSDLDGTLINTKEGKRIIHFAKMSIIDAYKVYSDIIFENEDEYGELKSFLDENIKPLI